MFAPIRLLVPIAALIASAPASAETITIWVKSFIPSSGPSAIVAVPNHPGQTMLDGGPVGCFLTDQRGFSNDLSKSARMTSMISFDLTVAGATNVSQSHSTGTTHKVNCSSGSTEGLCSKTAPTSDMRFHNIQFDKPNGFFSFTLESRASNPCVSLSPNIHYKVLFSFNVKNKIWGFTALTGQFPSFEGYMTVNSGPVIMLFQAPAQPFNGGTGIIYDRTQIERTGAY